MRIVDMHEASETERAAIPGLALKRWRAPKAPPSPSVLLIVPELEVRRLLFGGMLAAGLDVVPAPNLRAAERTIASWLQSFSLAVVENTSFESWQLAVRHVRARLAVPVLLLVHQWDLVAARRIARQDRSIEIMARPFSAEDVAAACCELMQPAQDQAAGG